MMGLDELNFLKETLLNIDEIDDKISAVNQQTEGFELRVEDKKGIITNRENEINEYKRKVKKGEKSSQDIINLYSNFDSELNQKQITDGEKEQKIKLWKDELESYWWDTHKKMGGLFSSYFFVPLLTAIVSMALLGRFGLGMSRDAALFPMCVITFLSIYILVLLSEKMKEKKSQKNREELESKFGELGYYKAKEIEHFRYNSEQKFGAYCVSKGKEPGYEVRDFGSDEPNITIRDWFGRIHSHLVPKILFLSYEEELENERIQKLELNLNKLRDYVFQGNIAKSAIPRNKKIIAKETKEIKQLETHVESNNNRIKQLDSERASLWKSISHMIPYSNLIKQ